jgi:hypothetical protein
MRRTLLAWSVAFSTVLLATSVTQAATPAAKAPAPKAAATAAEPTVGPDGIQRDPAGVRGMSPYNEALAKGRKAVEANEIDKAISAYQEAIQVDPKAAVGYHLLAQMQIAKGDSEAAAKTLKDARDKDGTEAEQSKVLMLTAILVEQKVPGTPSKPTLEALLPTVEEAKQAWQGFVAYVAGHPKALDYRATGTERNKQLDLRVEREKAYIPVKQRIADNAKERAEEAQKAAVADAAKGGR